jgi:hypothetical protein
MSKWSPSRIPLISILSGGLLLVGCLPRRPLVNQPPQIGPPPPTLIINAPQPNAQVCSPVPMNIESQSDLIGPFTLFLDGVIDTTDQYTIVRVSEFQFVVSGKLIIQTVGTHTLHAVANVSDAFGHKYLISATVTFTVPGFTFSYDEMGNLKSIVCGAGPAPPPAPTPRPPQSLEVH